MEHGKMIFKEQSCVYLTKSSQFSILFTTLSTVPAKAEECVNMLYGRVQHISVL